MIEYRAVECKWIEFAEGYGYWDYSFERVGEVNE